MSTTTSIKQSVGCVALLLGGGRLLLGFQGRDEMMNELKANSYSGTEGVRTESKRCRGKPALMRTSNIAR